MGEGLAAKGERMILVDPRIGSGELFTDIKLRVNGACEIADPQLPGGDFAWEGKGPDGPVYVGVERKRLSDMLTSLRYGRYAGYQAVQMSNMYDVCYLVVEGLWRPDQDGMLCAPKKSRGRTEWVPFTLAAKGPQSRNYFRYAELDKFLQAMEVKKNVIVVRSTSKLETVWQVVDRYQWWQKDWDTHESTDPIKMQTEITFQKISEQRMAMAAWPGIGLKKSKAVHARFGTIENAVNALPSEWREVDGIGETLSVKLYGFFRKK